MRELLWRAGYQFADSWLTTKIQAQYFADEDIKGREINVSTDDGVVTLSGTVDSEEAREQAINIARYTDGVGRVDDRLIVGGGATEEQIATTDALPGAVATAGAASAVVTDDQPSATSIQAKFFLDDAIKHRRIDVHMQDAVVTLRGEVASDAERAQALLLARTTAGVERVEDALTVNAALAPVSGVGSPFTPQAAPAPAAADDATLGEQVRSKLATDPQAKGASIDVTAKDGVLLLEGTVPTSAVKQQVLAIAREVEGVVQVVDRIRVE
jgi:osmotically-inducible protein OsmY